MPSMPKDVTALSSADFKLFFDSVDTVLTDCDGVIWLDNEVISNANKTLNKMRELGKDVVFVTNNSTKTREELIDKCHNLGFKAGQNDMVSTSRLVAEYLHKQEFKKKVYVIGSPAVGKELDKFGIRHFGIGPDVVGEGLPSYLENNFQLDPEVGAVVTAFDDHFSYPKMLKAASYLNNPNCLFLATNTDERVPKSNLIIPGTGSIIRCIETLSERKAFVVGKPTDYIKKAVTDLRNFDPKRTIMIGDRCNTDILFGRRCGFRTLLVLSGVTTLDEVAVWCKSDDDSQHELVPDYYAPKLGDLLPILGNISPKS